MNGRRFVIWARRSWKWLGIGVVGMLPMWVVSCQSYVPAPAAGPVAYSEDAAPASLASAGVRSGAAEMEWRVPDVQGVPNVARKSLAKPPVERPGLGTGWGDQVRSEMGYTSFARGSSKPYGGVAMIHYNDKEGVNAMTSWKYGGKGMQKAAGGLIEWGVKGRFGSLKNYHSGSRRFVVGRHGSRYSLVVKNLVKSRLEVVLSVDGLDVLDGKTGNLRKRGYIINPGQTLEVKGWRTSTSSVASFEFSSVSNSYANLGSGDARNVGVIGAAVYTEKGVSPFTWMPDEVRRRDKASPFAEPPLRRAR